MAEKTHITIVQAIKWLMENLQVTNKEALETENICKIEQVEDIGLSFITPLILVPSSCVC